MADGLCLVSSGLVFKLEMPRTCRVFSSGGKKTLKANTTFRIHGDTADYIYFLEKGVVSVKYCGPEESKPLLYLGGHCLVNDDFLMGKEGCPDLCVRAVVDVEIRSLPADSFTNLLDDIDLFKEIAFCMGEKAGKLIRQLIFLRFSDAAERAGRFLEELMELWAAVCPDPGQTLTLSQGEIADALAMHRVTVNRVLKKCTGGGN